MAKEQVNDGGSNMAPKGWDSPAHGGNEDRTLGGLPHRREYSIPHGQAWRTHLKVRGDGFLVEFGRV